MSKRNITKLQRRIIDYVAMYVIEGSSAPVYVSPEDLGVRRKNFERAARGLSDRIVPLANSVERWGWDGCQRISLTTHGWDAVSESVQAMRRLGAPVQPQPAVTATSANSPLKIGVYSDSRSTASNSTRITNR